MGTLTVGIIGAGAAGTAAARVLRQHVTDARIDLIARSGEQPFNRTLVNKGVAVGLLQPEQAVLPDTGAAVVSDTVTRVDESARCVTFRSNAVREYEALLVATGSRARTLDGSLPGLGEGLAAGRVTALHSLADAVRVRDRVAGEHPARILIFGGGLVAAETASLFAERGHGVALICRSRTPGSTALGRDLAKQLLALHRSRVVTFLGREPHELRTHSDYVSVRLDNGTDVSGDLVIVAQGTQPLAPAPWTDAGVPVDDRLRVRTAARHGLYAAGGVALHRHPEYGSFRIDHWNDAVAQGEHAARSLLHDRGLGDDPGAYLPTSTYVSSVYGRILSGVGHSELANSSRIAETEPRVIVHEYDGAPVAVNGLDAPALIRDWRTRLYRQSAATRL